MEAGVFTISVEPPENYLNMRIKAKDPDAPIPKKQWALRTSIYNALFVLRQLGGAPDSDLSAYAKQLKSIAELGLCGTEAQIDDAEEDLRQFKLRVVTHAGQLIKNRYAQILGRMAFVNAVAAAGLYAAIKGWPWLLDLLTRLGMNALDLIWLRSHMFAWCGAMAGAWVSFVLRNENIAFADLGRINPSWQAAQIRLLLTALQTLFIGLLMHMQMLSFQIGGFDTKRFPTDAVVALLVGVMCGYSEKTLSLVINSKATDLFKDKAQTAPVAGASKLSMLPTWLGGSQAKPPDAPPAPQTPAPRQTPAPKNGGPQ